MSIFDNFVISVAEDKMSASITVENDITYLPDVDEMMQLMQLRGIVFGVRRKYFEKKSLFFEALKKSRTIKIAEGVMPAEGEDSQIALFFQPGQPLQNIESDTRGRIDLKNLKNLENVPAGFLIAEKTPATRARPGRNVLGEVLPGRDGRNHKVAVGRNVTISADRSKYFATCAGTPVFADGVLEVEDVVTINGDVNYYIGEIDFVGDIKINGNIEQKFFLKSGKDIYIDGNAIGGSINAGRNIFVKNGIIATGKNVIRGGESVTARFIENSNIDAGRDITVQRWLLHNRMNCGGRIIVGDQGGEGLVMGGEYRAGISLLAEELGTDFFIKTLIEVNYRESYYQKDDLVTKLIMMKKNLNILEDFIKKSYNNIEKIKNSSRLNLIQKAEIIQEMGEKIYDNKQKQKELEKEISEFDLFLQGNKYILRPYVVAKKTVWPGVVIKINGTILRIRKKMEGTVFGFIDGKVTVDSYEEKKDELYWLN